MEPCDELSDFDKGQVVMFRELGVSVSQTAKLVGCSRAAVVRTYRLWYEEGLRLRAGRPRTIDPRELEDESGSDSEKVEEEEAAGGGAEEEEEAGGGAEEEEEEAGPGGQDAATSGTSAAGRDVDLETEHF